MRVLSLFSGVGLGDYGLELAGHAIVGQVELDEYCQKILALRWPDVPKWRDIRTVDSAELPACDLLAGGFPCQPFSLAGRRRGADDKRNLWPEMLRVITGLQPPWVLAENVPGILPYLKAIMLNDLEGAGYDVLTLEIPACAVGAPHRRDRLFILAYGGQRRLQSGRLYKRPQEKISKIKHNGSMVEYPANQGVPNGFQAAVGQPQPLTEFERPGRREIERDFCGVAHGVSHRVDRLKALGNGQTVPLVQWIGEQLNAVEK